MAIKQFSVSTVTLASSRVFDENGKSLVLGSLWSQTPVILVFLRHFACVSCRAHAVDVWNHKDKYQQAGARLHFIGNGAPHVIQTFKEDLKLQDCSVLTDPSLQSFQAAGLKRGILKALGPKSLLNGRKLFKEGHSQGAYSKDQGDLWQLGGILAVKPGGIVTYQYVSEATGDFPENEEIEKAPWNSAQT